METIDLYFIIALLVGILFPSYAIWGGRKLRQLLLSEPDKKVNIFRITAVQLTALTIITLIPFGVYQTNIATIGLSFIFNPLWIIILLTLSFFGWWLFSRIKLTKESAEKIATQNQRIIFFLPTNNKEYRHMIFVSFIAGICEEIIYRGFLLWFLTNYMPLVPSVILANLPFALGHLTSTGFKNSLKAFVLALVFTGAYLLTKSLWLPILLHILVDLYATILSYKTYQIMNPKKL